MGGLAGPIDDPGGAYHTMAAGQPVQAGQPTGDVGVTQTTAPLDAASLNSHLDSFFQASGWTREDVLVMAAAGQLVAWAVLLYVEVTR